MGSYGNGRERAGSEWSGDTNSGRQETRAQQPHYCHLLRVWRTRSDTVNEQVHIGGSCSKKWKSVTNSETQAFVGVQRGVRSVTKQRQALKHCPTDTSRHSPKHTCAYTAWLHERVQETPLSHTPEEKRRRHQTHHRNPRFFDNIINNIYSQFDFPKCEAELAQSVELACF